MNELIKKAREHNIEIEINKEATNSVEINILNNILDNVDIQISNISLMSDEQQSTLLDKLNDTSLDYPKDKYIIDLSGLATAGGDLNKFIADTFANLGAELIENSKYGLLHIRCISNSYKLSTLARILF